MNATIEARLRQKGIELPNAAAPGANYIPFVRTGNLVFISGQIAKWNGERRFIGKVGREFSVAEGREAARLCALNLVAVLREAAGGDLERVRRVVKLTGFVNATPDFLEPSQVIDGASDVLVEIFGEAGRHARSAVGVATLPYGVAVEVEAIFEIDGASMRSEVGDS